MDEKVVTRKEFDDAVIECAAQITMDHLETVEATVMFTMSGMAFAKKLRDTLFREEK